MTSTNGKSGNFITRLFHHNKRKSEEKVSTTAPAAPVASAESTKPTETKTMSKPTLYVFGGSVWASAPGLALIELKYTPELVEEKVVNLLEGDNFEPEFLRINISATLPTLTTGEKTYTSTVDCVEWLVLHAPTPGVKSAHQDAITAVHRENIDPNFSLLSARTPEELKAKRESVPGLFVRQRQAKLEKLAPQSPEDLKKFYEDKLAFNGFLSSVYADEPAAEVTSGWFDKSNQHWSDVKAFISTELATLLPESGFVDGEAPGEADFHIAAWLARTAGVTGAKPDDVSPLGEALGLTLDPKIVAYFDAWKARESWKKMYAEGLH
ncbi:glutathione S-transferase [Ceratobasidium sp. AG-Ba]|nr:glutathione S-transferase [Ceratobasidium sp. AG-Ba]QRV91031.1 glutathione S-transferase [Ceratobasidium sp. AG-Ba]QRW05122.1 glutathione S-transferase [Ceratobasidium sp. AG-Ba]